MWRELGERKIIAVLSNRIALNMNERERRERER